MDTPSDVSALDRLLTTGRIDAHSIVAVVGKTEGTGLGKDTARETVDRSVRARLAPELACTPDEVGDRLCMILSGGSPGVITPHIAIFSQRLVDADAPLPGGGRLCFGRAVSDDILPEEIGRMAHVRKVSRAVRAALDGAGVEAAEDAHAVLVKGPALTQVAIDDARRRGAEPVTLDLSVGPHGAMCYSNDASALGVAVATGEVPLDSLHDGVIRQDFTFYSDVAITSSASEKTHADVVVVANRRDGLGDLRVGHSSMTDVLDIGAVGRAVRSAGLPVQTVVDPDLRGRIVYVMAKMIIPGSDRIAGQRITLHDDAVGYHVAKAMGGYLVASTTGHTAAFVSGGERNSHQGPPDGNPLAAIVRVT